MSEAAGSGFRIDTDRLILRPWRARDGDAFAAMNADEAVMADLGGPIDREASDRKLERFVRSFELHRLTRWVVTEQGGEFLGYCGIVRQDEAHPLGEHWEIGWRLRSEVWGNGYAVEAASSALADASRRVGCQEVLAYTAPDNLRSQAVMRKLRLERRSDLDFTKHYDDVGVWRAMAWSWSVPDETSASDEL